MNNTENCKRELDDLMWDLKPNKTVENVTQETSDIYGEHLRVTLNTPMIEPDVEDVLDKYNARIKRPQVSADMNIVFEIEEVESQFISVGKNTVRKRGGSNMLALTPEAVEKANVSTGDTLNISCRDDQILLENTD